MFSKHVLKGVLVLIYEVKEVHMFRVPEGKEFLSYLSKYVLERGIRSGIIFAIGSVKNPVVGYFNEEKERYEEISFKGTYELLSALGNISLKDEKPFIHLHVVLGDASGKCYGGHLIRAEVFVAEVKILVLSGDPMKREVSHKNLALWRALEE